MTTSPVSHSNPKGKEKEKEQEKTKEKEKQQYPFEGFNIDGEGPTELMSSFSQWIYEGLYKHHAKKREKDDHYLANCSNLEFKQLDFVVAFPKKKDWFYVMSQPNKCWTDEHVDVILYYLRKKSKQQCHSIPLLIVFFKTYINSASVVPEYENKIVGTIKGFDIPGGLPWHLTDEAYVPVNYNGEFHWVLAVVVLKERCTKVYDSMSSSRTNIKLCPEIQKLSTLLPKDCGFFVVAYTMFLSDGLKVSFDGISSETLRMRYASLLCNYGILKAWSGYVSNNEDPQRPRPKKTKFDENVVVTTID
ncbi:hypothetical protein H5410_041060 [Solanum commersonii]|uniref:Ubiquitin-like protease family profile domain-containing protein n=1 Tax=Solanum commersonii TaxID=4109 RepID=A0A9J5XRY8_SOLCO|nr:hypothetical protein H5410_041060 [Solanum commersonii]